MVPWLSRAAPDAIAVEADDGALRYAELAARARAGAAELAGHERVAIALPPGLDFAVALHACLLAGAAAVPLDLREPQPRLAGATITIDGPLPTATTPLPAGRLERADARPSSSTRRGRPGRRGRSSSRSARSSTTRSAVRSRSGTTGASAGCARCRSAMSAG